MIRRAALISALVAATLFVAGPIQADTKATALFGAATRPSAQDPMPIGSYAKGCAAGLVELPESGPGWQAMRLSRNRNWGHPVTIAFLEDLGQTAQRIGWSGLYVGDISQPRGGPAASGHRSHQIGLDADIWMLPPSRIDLSPQQREKISSISVRTADQLAINANFTPQHRAILKAAAADPRVDRIFVAAAIKLAMCKTATPADKAWLQKIRPEAGHDDHFHVRLKCPKGARLCETQSPTVAELSKGGDGCDETLQWWVSDAYLHPKPSKTPAPATPRKRGARDYTMADLPKQCQDVLSSR